MKEGILNNYFKVILNTIVITFLLVVNVIMGAIALDFSMLDGLIMALDLKSIVFGGGVPLF